EFVRRIHPIVRSTFRPEVLTDIGAFGGLFRFDSARYREPVLVSGTDGVGTKLKIATLMGRHDTVGIDLVAMCVNDVAVCGAEPRQVIDGRRVQPGVVVVGLASTGLHSNGYSLARQVLLQNTPAALQEKVSGWEETVGEVLLKPTRIYVKTILQLIKSSEVHAIAHI